MGTWLANKPDSNNSIKEVPEICQDNFDAIEDILGVEHYTFTDGTLSGQHKKTSTGTITIATTSGDFATSPSTGVLGYGWGSMGGTYSGVLLHYTGSAWDRIGEDEWSRVRAYPTSAITITGGAGSSAVTATFDTKSYDTLSEYDSNIGTFTASASGSYAIVASIGLSSALSVHNTVTVGLYKNGTLLESTQHDLYESGGTSSTSITAYSDAHPETTTVDGFVIASVPTGTDWATLISTVGDYSDDDSQLSYVYYIIAGDTTDRWEYLTRAIFLFDTSSIPDDATITSAILSLYGYFKSDSISLAPDVDIYTSTPASDISLTSTDYQQLGNISQTSNPIAYDDLIIDGYNNFTLNSTGRGNINKTGISKFGARNACYDANGVPPTYLFGSHSNFIVYNADSSYGTTRAPKLVVNYYASGSLTQRNQTATLSTIVSLNAGDTLQIRVSKPTVGDENDVILADSSYSFIAIHRLSGVCF